MIEKIEYQTRKREERSQTRAYRVSPGREAVYVTCTISHLVPGLSELPILPPPPNPVIISRNEIGLTFASILVVLFSSFELYGCSVGQGCM